jgi:hypothetical protein
MLVDSVPISRVYTWYNAGRSQDFETEQNVRSPRESMCRSVILVALCTVEIVIQWRLPVGWSFWWKTRNIKIVVPSSLKSNRSTVMQRHPFEHWWYRISACPILISPTPHNTKTWAVKYWKGRVIAQAVPTAAALVQSCGILWWTKVALGQVISENFCFPCTIYILSASPQSSSISPEAGTIGQEWPQCQ